MLAHIFVYGTLRAGHDGPQARRLRMQARHVGPARAAGRLYRVEDYPGFVPGEGGQVLGDLFLLADPAASLAWLDDYEQCGPAFAPPQEYGRVAMRVDGPQGPVEAWTYIFLHTTDGLERIEGGDFLADGAA